MKSFPRALRSLAALALIAFASPASAVLSVGPAPCAFRTVQGAIDALLESQRNGDFADNEIIIGPGTFGEALTIDGAGIPQGALIFISGGYDAGCNGPQAGSVTAISAASHSNSALTIHGFSRVFLTDLTITGAHTSGRGGGIDFDGTGSLDATRVSIVDNSAGYGAGIYANGQGNGISITLHIDTTIVGNSALHAGGGIRIQGLASLAMREPGVVLSGNTARVEDDDGTGGGLQVIGPAAANIGAIEISSNLARYGGGIAAIADDTNAANVTIAGTPFGTRARVVDNRATHTGGGIFATANFINSSGSRVESTVSCTDCAIDENQAAEGAAIYADTASDFVGNASAGGRVFLRRSSVNGNAARDQSLQPTDGAAILIQSKGTFESKETEIRGNAGGHAYRGFEGNASTPPALFENTLVAENATSSNLIAIDNGGDVTIRSSTIANNTIANGEGALALSGSLAMNASIVWQPGHTTVLGNPNELDIQNVIASEIPSLGGGNTILQVFPGFVNMAGGDYTLLSDAAALDFAPASSLAVDLAGNARTVDLARADRPGGGPLDLGAYELQGIGSLNAWERFDTQAAPALPEGWSASHSGASTGWHSTSGGAFTSPNAAFVGDVDTYSDSLLITPPFTVLHAGSVSFQHKFSTELHFDCVALEISIAGAPFTDIVAAGGAFLRGGYNTVPGDCGATALNARNVWSGHSGGDSGGYEQVLATLPAAAEGRSVRLRWHATTDASNAGPGYWLDDVHVVTERLFCDSMDGAPCL